MPHEVKIQANFNKGELSPLLYGRVDFDGYKTGLATCLNHILQVQGPVTRRPGTIYMARTKFTTATRLLRFRFSTTQAYVIEVGNYYMRFYANHGQVQSGGVPVEIETPYPASAVWGLSITQSADILYLAHPQYPPATVVRSSNTEWSYAVLTFQDGPYLDQNITPTTFTFGAATGTDVLLTASSTTGINGGSGFVATDVGRMVRAQASTGNWGWGTIVAVNTTTTCHVSIVQTMTNTSAQSAWALGMWGAGLGYPACCTFYQDRLGWAGASADPQTITLSATSGYTNHAPTAYDTLATVASNNGLNFTLNSNDVQLIKWIEGDANGLLVGTDSGEWLVTPSTQNEALTPTNLNAINMTSYGESPVQPVRVGYTTLALQKSGRKVREFVFVYYENRYHAPDMTVLAQHITLGGITQLAFQQEPNSIVWAPRADGTLLGFTYERDQQVTGWHRHTLGGFGDANGDPPLVMSVATVPTQDLTRDEVYMIVQRYVGGQTIQTVEYMTKIWEHGDSLLTACYGDCALQYAGTPVTYVTGFPTIFAGETMGCLVNGAAHPNVVVDANGGVTLDRPGSNVTIGYTYNSDGETLRPEIGAAAGTSQGMTKRTNKIAFLLWDSLGLSSGPSFTQLTPTTFENTGNLVLGTGIPLFSGYKRDNWDGDYSFDDNICWRFTGMFPGTLQDIVDAGTMSQI